MFSVAGDYFTFSTVIRIDIENENFVIKRLNELEQSIINMIERPNPEYILRHHLIAPGNISFLKIEDFLLPKLENITRDMKNALISDLLDSIQSLRCTIDNRNPYDFIDELILM